MLRAPTVTDELRNNVRFAPGWKVGKKLRSLTDAERDMVVAATVEHIRLCNWKVARGRRRVGLRSWGGGQVANKKAPPRRGPIQTTERAPGAFQDRGSPGATLQREAPQLFFWRAPLAKTIRKKQRRFPRPPAKLRTLPRSSPTEAGLKSCKKRLSKNSRAAPGFQQRPPKQNPAPLGRVGGVLVPS